MRLSVLLRDGAATHDQAVQEEEEVPSEGPDGVASSYLEQMIEDGVYDDDFEIPGHTD